MYRYSIEPYPLHKGSDHSRIHALLGNAFDGPSPAADYLIQKVCTHGTQPSTAWVAVEDGEIIGCNCFIAHDFFVEGQLVVGYQSCFSATHPNHRGKKIFQNIIEHAKAELSKTGAGFIFGWSNPNSTPIFIQKLAFEHSYTAYRQYISLPQMLWGQGIFNWDKRQSFLPEPYMVQNDDQLIALKRQLYGDKVCVHSDQDNFLWGVVRTKRKAGLRVSYLDIGGIMIHNPHTVHTLFRSVAIRLLRKGIPLLSIIMHEKHAYLTYMPGAKTYTAPEPFIYYPLNYSALHQVRLNFFAGLKDVY